MKATLAFCSSDAFSTLVKTIYLQANKWSLYLETKSCNRSLRYTASSFLHKYPFSIFYSHHQLIYLIKNQHKWIIILNSHLNESTIKHYTQHEQHLVFIVTLTVEIYFTILLFVYIGNLIFIYYTNTTHRRECIDMKFNSI